MKSIPDDRTLVSQLIQKDTQALYWVYKTYQKDLRHFVSSRLSEKQQVDEIVQDIFIQFLEGLRDFRFQCSVKTFLFTLARNKIIDSIRKKKMAHIVFSKLPDFVVDSLGTVTLDQDWEQRDLEEKLARTFALLPHDYRFVLRLKYMEQKSVQEIAAQLVRSFKSTESMLFRARKAFMTAFAQLS